ncbi:PREDICTED: uncharacterized protein LOC109237616 [Nicotiana attenuata]|uniref:GRF-type domain-containing protein n=1 Tax=Nicotiana attenuata TaxID=49451 RepID=A0A1J6J6W0_NICAT|nr:PREDICTED: uncharacterized protein LOC109237616 [Nicotiana attenuata]OIT08384.1 hypothetical protein A4A49_51654 [Nicotiana attenuata]
MENSGPFCRCGDAAELVISWSTDSPGRRFYGCKNYKKDKKTGCKYFAWFDPPTHEHLKPVILGLLKKKNQLEGHLQESKKQRNWRRIFFLILGLIFIKAIVFGTPDEIPK